MDSNIEMMRCQYCHEEQSVDCLESHEKHCEENPNNERAKRQRVITDTADAGVAGVAAKISDPKWVMKDPIHHGAGGHEWKYDEGARTFEAAGPLHGGSMSRHELRLHHMWCHWIPEGAHPAVQLHIHIPAGRYDLQEKVAKKLLEAVSDIMEEVNA